LEITKVLSIFAAALSTVVFIWDIGRAIPRYKVDLTLGVGDEADEYKLGVYVSVKNPSPQTVHLASVSILYPTEPVNLIGRIKKYRRLPYSVGWVYSSLSNYDIDDKCPIALEPGTSLNVFVPEEVVKEILKDNEISKLKASVQDQLWRNKYSSELSWP